MSMEPRQWPAPRRISVTGRWAAGDQVQGGNSTVQGGLKGRDAWI